MIDLAGRNSAPCRVGRLIGSYICRATILSLLLLPGCVTVTYTSPEGHTFTVTRQFSTTAIGNLRVVRPDGTEVIIEGYQSDQTMLASALIEMAQRVAAGGAR